jgi:hypothetical protein
MIILLLCGNTSPTTVFDANIHTSMIFRTFVDVSFLQLSSKLPHRRLLLSHVLSSLTASATHCRNRQSRRFIIRCWKKMIPSPSTIGEHSDFLTAFTPNIVPQQRTIITEWITSYYTFPNQYTPQSQGFLKQTQASRYRALSST